MLIWQQLPGPLIVRNYIFYFCDQGSGFHRPEDELGRPHFQAFSAHLIRPVRRCQENERNLSHAVVCLNLTNEVKAVLPWHVDIADDNVHGVIFQKFQRACCRVTRGDRVASRLEQRSRDVQVVLQVVYDEQVCRVRHGSILLFG